MKDYERKALMLNAINAALKAGREILDVYGSDDFEVEIKSDNSPLTLADRRAHEAIVAELKDTGLPVLSEESRSIPYAERKAWKSFWLVDPLDGTKEFIKRNGEFTVNIALVEEHKPILGVIYVPVQGMLYAGDIHSGAYRLSEASLVFTDPEIFPEKAEPLPRQSHKTFGVVASRSHMNNETSAFISGLQRKYPDLRIVSKGSSLKLCMIAEGEADIYPRFGPTSEWDTAAGHALVSAAGGKVLIADSENGELQYNKPEVLNPWFIALRENTNQ